MIVTVVAEVLATPLTLCVMLMIRRCPFRRERAGKQAGSKGSYVVASQENGIRTLNARNALKAVRPLILFAMTSSESDSRAASVHLSDSVTTCE